MQSLNQNTGAGASQNSAVTLTVTTGNILSLSNVQPLSLGSIAFRIPALILDAAALRAP